jgi:hypothetical protein
MRRALPGLLLAFAFGSAAQAAPDGARTGREEPDAAVLPVLGHASVHRAHRPAAATGELVGLAASLESPRFSDRRRRVPVDELPRAFGGTLRAGERFVFDVYFAGNPAGLAEAWVDGIQADPRGDPPAGSPVMRLAGKATTSGIVSLLASVTDEMTSLVDAHTGAAVQNVNVVRRSGLMAEYKLRRTTIDFEGRGKIRVVDDKDGKTRKLGKVVPRDTLDPLGAMAWVRSLDLDEGERGAAHAMDGSVLLRVEVVGRGPVPLDPMPSIASGLRIAPQSVRLIEGTATRVDRFDVPLPGKRPYTFRAWVSDDDRAILLALESDMWLGVVRIVLAGYDPPARAAGRADGVQGPADERRAAAGRGSVGRRPRNLLHSPP